MTQHRRGKLPRASSPSCCLLSRDLINSLELISRASTLTLAQKKTLMSFLYNWEIWQPRMLLLQLRSSFRGTAGAKLLLSVTESKCPCSVSLRLDPRRQQLLPLWLTTNPLMELQGNNYSAWFSTPHDFRFQISFSLEWHSIVGHFHSIKQSHLVVKSLSNRGERAYLLIQLPTDITWRCWSL